MSGCSRSAFTGAEPDERTAALIAIAHASQLGRALVDDVPWKEIKTRAKAIVSATSCCRR